ncbi:MAG: hypothetical protein K2I00_01480 [Ruminococcus sp.]|nr:hypothetical protein [Ruminococcus sp.]
MSTTYIFNQKINNKNIDREQFKESLIKILRKTDIDMPQIIAQQFLSEIDRKIDNLSRQENFVAQLIKGNAHKEIINIDIFFTNKNVFITPSQKKEIHDLIQLLLASRLNEYKTFQYVTQTFPLMSFLKRQLLETRPGTNIPQWQFIAENCFIKENITEQIKEYFSTVANYKEISDRKCAQIVSALVKSLTGKRFDTTISQQKQGRGWYPNGLDELPEKFFNVNPEHLFLIAYSFKMNIDQYDEMLIRNGDVYDCFCYEENMLRFLLVYIKNINEYNAFKQIIEQNREHFQESSDEFTPEQVARKINNFFCSRRRDDIKSLCIDFMKLLKRLGVVSAEKRREILNQQRRLIAGANMQKLLKSTNLKNITVYYSLLNNTVDDIMRFKYKNEPEKIGKALEILESNYRQLAERTSENEKAKILSMLCDRFAPESSSYIKTSIRPILKSRFSTEHIGKISKGTTTDPITRTDILKIGYLQTLIDFINKNNQFRNKSEMIEACRSLTRIFEENTNKILKKCSFAPVHATFPLDGLIYIALSSGTADKCIPEVFQACLPIDMTRRTE